MTSKKLANQINALSRPQAPGSGPIADAQLRDPVAGAVGRVRASQASGGGSIASPLTEESRETEEYEVTDSVGIVITTVERIKTLKMTDANGDTVVFNFDVATAP